jgi:alkylation response protein AidB-like acyl-CoA dehydrogenase
MEIADMRSVLEGVGALAEEISERIEQLESGRRMPADLVRKIAETGAFRMLVPKAYGGLELSPMEASMVIEMAAMIDASVGWCVMIASTIGMTAAYLPEKWGKEIFSDPMTITGGAFAPTGKAVRTGNTLTVNGQWSWISGGQNCTWLLGGCVIEVDGAIRRLANGAPDHRMVFWPADQATLHDTWHSAGLKGTGSLDMSVSNVVAPYERSVSLIADKPLIESPLYAFPAFSLLAIGVASVALGNARGALEGLRAMATAKRPQGSSRTLAERAHTQMEFAKAEAQIRSARAFLQDATSEAFHEATRNAGFGLQDRAALRLAATHAARTGADVCRAMYELGGGSSVYLSNALQRRFRDGATAIQHMLVQPSTYELTGRVFLGLETDASTL